MNTPAGWYPDPEGRKSLRWWNGEAWTEQWGPMQPALPAGELRRDQVSGGESFGQALLIAVLLPIVGFIWGIVELTKGRFAHAFTLMGVSVVTAIVASAVIASLR